MLTIVINSMERKMFYIFGPPTEFSTSSSNGMDEEYTTQIST